MRRLTILLVGPFLTMLVAVGCSRSVTDVEVPAATTTTTAPTTTAPTTTTTTTTTPTTTTTTTAPTTTTTTTAPTTTTPPPPVWDELLVAEVVDVWLAEGTPVTPGVSVAVLLPDGTEMLVASGLADLVAQEPVTTDDYFRIGSISKTITSVAMLQLVSEGLVDLDEPVATYVGDLLDGYILDGVDYGDQVTVRQVLNHTDGFAEYAFDLGFYLLMSERLETVVEPEEIIDWAISMGPQYVPGTAYSYNTVGHNVVGLIIESVTGQPAHEVLRERIFDPLGLDDIFLPPAEDPPEPVVHGYAATVLKAALDAIPTTASYPEADLGDVYDISVVPQEAIRSAGWTGGSIEAQVLDVARIFRAMFDGTLLDDAMVAEFLTTSEFSDYGLGISVGEADVNTAGAAAVVANDALSYSHGGGVPGFRSHAAYFPDHDIAIAVSANVLPADPDVGELADRILGALLNEAELEPLPASDDSDALGAILDSEPVDLGGWLHLGEAWRVVYRSEAVNGNPIEVTGVIIAPAGSTDDSRPVLSITHGTTGLADDCAPSLGFPDDYTLGFIAPLLEQGWVVVATDYEGLGGPGLHPYIVGESEARGAFDIVRAAQKVPGLGADGPLVVWGHSQGGHAAMHVAERWTDLAPDLDLVGVAAGAPPSQFPLLSAFLQDGDFQGYLTMAGAGLAAAYDELDLEPLIAPEYEHLLDELENGCTGHIFEVFNPIPYEDLLTVDDIFALPEWNARLIENDTNQRPNEVPTIILHGDEDEQIPVVSSEALLAQLCDLEGHAPLERRVYPGTNHGTSVTAYHDELMDWLKARVAGEPALDQCGSGA